MAVKKPISKKSTALWNIIKKLDWKLSGTAGIFSDREKREMKDELEKCYTELKNIVNGIETDNIVWYYNLKQPRSNAKKENMDMISLDDDAKKEMMLKLKEHDDAKEKENAFFYKICPKCGNYLYNDDDDSFFDDFDDLFDDDDLDDDDDVELCCDFCDYTEKNNLSDEKKHEMLEIKRNKYFEKEYKMLNEKIFNDFVDYEHIIKLVDEFTEKISLYININFENGFFDLKDIFHDDDANFNIFDFYVISLHVNINYKYFNLKPLYLENEYNKLKLEHEKYKFKFKTFDNFLKENLNFYIKNYVYNNYVNINLYDDFELKFVDKYTVSNLIKNQNIEITVVNEKNIKISKFDDESEKILNLNIDDDDYYDDLDDVDELINEIEKIDPNSVSYKNIVEPELDVEPVETETVEPVETETVETVETETVEPVETETVEKFAFKPLYFPNINEILTKEPELELELDVEPETETETELDVEPETETNVVELELELDVEPETETEPELDVKLEPETNVVEPETDLSLFGALMSLITGSFGIIFWGFLSFIIKTKNKVKNIVLTKYNNIKRSLNANARAVNNKKNELRAVVVKESEHVVSKYNEIKYNINNKAVNVNKKANVYKKAVVRNE